MQKTSKLSILVFLIVVLWNSVLYSQNQNNLFGSEKKNSFGNNSKETIHNKIAGPCDIPTVISPIYYCQNTTASPLDALVYPGSSLKWYSNASGGTATTIAPTPSTVSVGSTTYYVSQTDGICESIRVPIVVTVTNDTGVTIQNFRCDPTQVTTSNSVFFDWSNIIGHPPNAYNYSYSISSGVAVKGNCDETHLEIFGLLPGQSATLIITSVVGFPCVPPIAVTCSLPCTSTTTPNFPPIDAICSGSTAPILVATSPNGIVGSWLPPIVDNLISGSYVFTPDPLLFPCAIKQTLLVDVLSEPKLKDGSICIDQTTNNVLKTYVLNTGLSNSNYTFKWYFGGILIPGAMSSTYEASEVGTYQVIATNNSTACVSLPVSANVIASFPGKSITITQTPAFTEETTISVSVFGGNGVYEFKLDNGPVQSSNAFINVNPGTHIVSVTDTNGCTNLSQNIFITGFPKFFTPNGDGYNDFWNLIGFSNQPLAKIYIFDRYGKLLKQINPDGEGWDGTYTGQMMPATDYWFTVEYSELSTTKVFKSHFSLLR